ncbi:hypothetical protein [Syntrophobotulus glycolicus]|nr:hypothetical protein [Syntrophobotulus glycolicus]
MPGEKKRLPKRTPKEMRISDRRPAEPAPNPPPRPAAGDCPRKEPEQ